ncbi:MAG TPA: 2-methylcitrate synthase [Gammaproteobacteria bacterium]|nr:2-methylcitrate synthase [Gammaproteobacteria bacterium]
MAKSQGLEGIVVGETAISTVGKGLDLTYRGYSIEDLAKHASFEEVAYLLLYGRMPTIEELRWYQYKLVSLRFLPHPLTVMLEQLPESTHPMDVLRTGCSMLGALEPETFDHNPLDIADRLLACIPSMLLYWHHFHKTGMRIQTSSFDETIAGFFLSMLYQQKPSEEFRRAFDVSLILYAEHEFNASTFAARVTTSTQSDFYSAIVSGIGTLRGPLHGGANEAAMELIQQFKTPEAAEIGIKEMLAHKKKIMGFGHRVYKKSDPRSDIIKQWSEKLSKHSPDGYMYAVSERIEKVMRDEKNIFPNLDFYSATAYHFCDIPTYLFTPIFVLSRITGWTAHILEQRQNNRLIRPEAEYIGPKPQPLIPLAQRKL